MSDKRTIRNMYYYDNSAKPTYFVYLNNNYNSIIIQPFKLSNCLPNHQINLIPKVFIAIIRK